MKKAENDAMHADTEKNEINTYYIKTQSVNNHHEPRIGAKLDAFGVAALANPADRKDVELEIIV